MSLLIDRFQGKNELNLKSINIRSIIIIKQIQNMNLMLNMKDISKDRKLRQLMNN